MTNDDNAPLERIWNEVEARRGRRWAYPDLDPARTGLVVCEPTQAALSAVEQSQPICAKINWLAEAVRGAGGRVGWSFYGADETPRIGDMLGDMARADRAAAAATPKRDRIHEEFQVHIKDLLHTRRGYSAFFQGACHMGPILRSYNVDTIILAGFHTNVEVDANARDALAAGYRVVIAADACGAAQPNLHWASLETLHSAFGDVRLSQDIAAAMRQAAA